MKGRSADQPLPLSGLSGRAGCARGAAPRANSAPVAGAWLGLATIRPAGPRAIPLRGWDRAVAVGRVAGGAAAPPPGQ